MINEHWKLYRVTSPFGLTCQSCGRITRLLDTGWMKGDPVADFTFTCSETCARNHDDPERSRP